MPDELVFQGITEPVPARRWRALFDATGPSPPGSSARGIRRVPHSPTRGGCWAGTCPSWCPPGNLSPDRWRPDTRRAYAHAVRHPPRLPVRAARSVLVEDRPAAGAQLRLPAGPVRAGRGSSAFTGRRRDRLRGLPVGSARRHERRRARHLPHPRSGTPAPAPASASRGWSATCWRSPTACRRRSRRPGAGCHGVQPHTASTRGVRRRTAVGGTWGSHPRCPPTAPRPTYRGLVPADAVARGGPRSANASRRCSGCSTSAPTPKAVIEALPAAAAAQHRLRPRLRHDVHRCLPPGLGVVDYVWPGSRWRRGFDSP